MCATLDVFLEVHFHSVSIPHVTLLPPYLAGAAPVLDQYCPSKAPPHQSPLIAQFLRAPIHSTISGPHFSTLEGTDHFDSGLNRSNICRACRPELALFGGSCRVAPLSQQTYVLDCVSRHGRPSNLPPETARKSLIRRPSRSRTPGEQIPAQIIASGSGRPPRFAELPRQQTSAVLTIPAAGWRRRPTADQSASGTAVGCRSGFYRWRYSRRWFSPERL